VTPAESSPNVLLVVMDSVRARNCSLYGYRNQTTPFLDALADEATVYTQARAPSNWSLPSHVSLLTGIETHAHRVTVHDRLQPGATVFETLAERGYDTGLFSENGFLTAHETGIKHAFETVVGVPDAYDDQYDTTALNPAPDGFYFADAFDQWRQNRDRPWAACVNLMDAHRPFEPRDRFDQWGEAFGRQLQEQLPTRWEWAFYGESRPYWELQALEQLYDGGIRQTDAVLRRIVSRLRTTGALDNTLLVICGDHGDGFGQPGRLPAEPPAVSHIVPMSESLLHVPLVVRPPGGGHGDRCHHPAALTAFPEVVLDRIDGTARPKGFASQQVVATKQPVTDDLRQRFVDHCAEPDRFFQPSQAVYVASPGDGRAVRKQYFWGDDGVECRIDSAGNVTELSAIDPSRVRRAIDSTEVDIREPLSGEQVTNEAKEQLAALGYY
jgi:arylsulfatase A-like enzyme